ASLNRPGGNATGVTFLATALVAKRLEIMSEVAPKASNIGVLVNPNNASAAAEISDVEAAARAIGKQGVVLRASTGRGIAIASDALVRPRVRGLMIAADAFFEGRSNQIVDLAAQQAMPAIHFSRQPGRQADRHTQRPRPGRVHAASRCRPSA